LCHATVPERTADIYLENVTVFFNLQSLLYLARSSATLQQRKFLIVINSGYISEEKLICLQFLACHWTSIVCGAALLMDELA